MSSIKTSQLLASTVEFLPRKSNEEDWGGKKKEATAPGSVRGVWAGNTILGDQQLCLQRCSLACHVAFSGSFPFEMNIMLITGAKLTALKVEVPSYKIKCSKQQ